MAESLSRFKALGGTARQYLDMETGAVISRYQRDKLTGLYEPRMQEYKLKLEAGYTSPMSKYNRLVADFRESMVKKGFTSNEIRVRGDSYSAKTFQMLNEMLKTKDKSASGSKAAALVEIGRRDKEWKFDVGETPK